VVRDGANSPLVGSYNRQVVLETIRVLGPTSRVEIAGTTGLTAQTVSAIVRRLLADGLVSEAGQGEPTGGKPRTLLRINAQAGHAVGVQIDPREASFVVADLDGAVIARARRDIRPHTPPEDVVGMVADQVRRVIAAAGLPESRISGVGIACPGPIDQGKGLVLQPPNLPGWGQFPLRDALTEACGFEVTMGHDATGAAIGEHWVGGTAHARNFAFVFLGTGVGTGIFLDGQVYSGTTSNAGEFGHISIDRRGRPCVCGNRGCVEVYCSPAAIVAENRRREGRPAVSGGADLLAEYRSLCRDAASGDTVAAAVFRDAADVLGSAAVSLVNLLDLELIVLGGTSLDGVGELYRAAVEQAVRERTIARQARDVRVTVSGSGLEAGALGAASLVFYRAYSPRLGALARADARARQRIR
jgi:predicted NBD/HSP70 family sugar kinase